MRVLVLGGSTEASALARLLAEDARFDATLSLAGRTAAPLAQPIPARVGGFGGVEGLARHLQTEQIEVLIDATHPFASRMSRNAIEATSLTATRLLAVERPAWQKQPDDHWIEAADMPGAVAALGVAARRVFSGIGSLALGSLKAAPQHTYVIRLIDLPRDLVNLPSIVFVRARGPFTTANDIELFHEHRVEIVLAKNSGGDATVSKIEAARALGLPVVMIDRPFIPLRETVPKPEDAMVWLAQHHENSAQRGV